MRYMGCCTNMALWSPKEVAKFRQTVVGKLEAEKAKLTPLSQEMFGKLVEEFAVLEKQLAYYQEKLEALAQSGYPRKAGQ
jgi:hypothetical protein